MEIMHELISFPQGLHLKIKWDEFAHFTFPRHYHPEYEIVYIIKSYGKRFVGDNIEEFRDGDVVLIGSNLPHYWKNDSIFYQKDTGLKVQAIIIHFTRDFFKTEFDSYYEFSSIKDLLQRASKGVVLESPDREKIGKYLMRLIKLSGLKQTLYFLKILDIFARTKDYRLLSSEYFQNDFSYLYGNNRMDKIMEFINQHYKEKIKLEDISNCIGMNSAYFSRYFKEKTGKSFISFVNEIRISYACDLLIDNNMSVSQICFECGFNNISNFNRIFKKKTGFSPLEYQKMHNTISNNSSKIPQ